MKRIFFLLSLVLLLCGCSKENTLSSKEDETKWSFPKSPEDEENQVFFTCQNYNYDLYLEYTIESGPEFFILSRQHIDSESISVIIPTKTKYEVSVCEEKVMRNISNYQKYTDENGCTTMFPVGNSNLDFPMFLYQTYRGVDWNALKVKKTELAALMQRYEKAVSAEDESHEELFKEYQSAAKRYEEDRMRFFTEYQKLEEEDFPEFYMYSVQVTFDYKEREKENFHSMQVQIGEKAYDLDIGEIRIHKEGMKNTAFEEDNALTFRAGFCPEFPSYPYGKGLVKCESAMLEALDDITLTAYTLTEETAGTAELLEMEVRMTDDISGTNAVEMRWDGKTPISIPKGKYFEMDVVVHDERLKELCYGGQIYPALNYEHNGKTYTYVEAISLTRKIYEPWFWYAAGLDNLNLETYFNNCYYEERENWQKAFLKE